MFIRSRVFSRINMVRDGIFAQKGVNAVPACKYETVQMRGHNIWFRREIKKNYP